MALAASEAYGTGNAIEEGDFTLRDVKGLERQAGKHFRAHGMVMGGSWRATLPPIA